MDTSSGPCSAASGEVYDRRIPLVTHLLTHRTTAPSLYDQLLVNRYLPPSLSLSLNRSDYPPLKNPPSLRWAFALFLRRCLPPPSSWRSGCPFQQPPPAVLSSKVAPAPPCWTLEERRARVRQRLRRPPLGVRVPPWLGIGLPNALLLSVLLWEPLSLSPKGGAQ